MCVKGKCRIKQSNLKIRNPQNTWKLTTEILLLDSYYLAHYMVDFTCDRNFSEEFE